MSKPLLVWFNGASVVASEGSSVDHVEPYLLDRASSFGDGVFETLLIKNGSIVFLERHLHRLSQGLHRLSIPCVRDQLSADLQLLAPFIDQGDSFVLKIIVSRGSSVFGYSSRDSSVNRLLLLQPYQPVAVDNLCLMVCDTRLSTQPLLAGIKHCNRLEQVLARREVDDSDCHEGLMLDQQGLIIETTAANLFIVESNQLITPPIIDAGVIGVVREFLIDILVPKLGFPLRKEPIDLTRIEAADACLLTNSVQGLRQASTLKLSSGISCQWSQHALLMQLQQAYQVAIS